MNNCIHKPNERQHCSDCYAEDLALKRELVKALKTVKKNCTKEELRKINDLIRRAEATL